MSSSARAQQLLGAEALVIQREMQLASRPGQQFARVLARAAELETQRSVQKLTARKRWGALASEWGWELPVVSFPVLVAAADGRYGDVAKLPE